jgi:hypothetical protein
MTGGNLLLWVVWALFAAALVWLLCTRYLRAVLAGPPARAASPAAVGSPWLFCEDGSSLDRRAAWFRVRAGGTTVVGNRPRAATGGLGTIYLTAHDVGEQHLTIRYDPVRRRYLLEAGDGKVMHNNEPLPKGASAPLTDGDTIDLGDLTRLRFTFTGPPEVQG